ncbi:MAG: hypothetical protein WA418_16840 [Bradyrhizobium sp.]
MARGPIELPPAVARAFVRDMQAFFAEEDPHERDQIAVLQLRSLQVHWNRKPPLEDVRRMFDDMKEHLRK